MIKHHTIISIVHQTKQPEQLIIRLINGNTLLIFKSGCFRIMGKNDDISNHLNIYEILSQFSTDIPEIGLQTMTICYNYGKKLSLNKMAEEPYMHYTAEFFLLFICTNSNQF